MKKVILDTDIGSDIDDAVCLAYLLNQPECELMGITTVSGEPVKRAEMASAMCKITGNDIPIYSGRENPLIIDIVQAKAQQHEKLGTWEHETGFCENSAINFMKKTIRENPNEITLLAIGPLTNIALLFLIDPEIPSLLKELVLMCGKFTYENDPEEREWNALCDPHATKIVYAADVKIHRSIGLDVTKKVQMKKEDVKNNFKADILKPVLDFSEVWFRKTDYMTFHDPLAAAVIFDDSICKFEKGNVDIELSDKKNEGFTYFSESESGRHEVALAVDPDKFIKHYFDTVNK